MKNNWQTFPSALVFPYKSPKFAHYFFKDLAHSNLGEETASICQPSPSQRHRECKEQRTLNLTTSLLLLILTERASFLFAVRRKSLISWICFGIFSGGERRSVIRTELGHEDIR